MSAGAVVLDTPEVARFPEELSFLPPEPGDFRATALHAQQISDAGGTGAGKQRVESVSKVIAGTWHGDEPGLGSLVVFPSCAWSRGIHAPLCQAVLVPRPLHSMEFTGRRDLL